MALYENVMQLLEDHHIKNQQYLLIRILTELGEQNPYEKADKEKSNFSNMLHQNRPMKADYILPLEKILGVSYYEMLNGNSELHSRYTPHGLEYTASLDQYEAYEALDRERGVDDESVFDKRDEYEHVLLDYIVQYHSLNGIRFLADKYQMNYRPNDDHLSFNGFNGLMWYTRSGSENMMAVVKMICEADDPTLFGKVFDGFKIPLCAEKERCLYFTDEFLSTLLHTSKILHSLMQERELQLKDVNLYLHHGRERTGLFINPLLNCVLDYVLKNDAECERGILLEIMRYGIEFGKRQVDSYRRIERDSGETIIDEFGNIIADGIIYGNLLTVNYLCADDTPKDLIPFIEQLSAICTDIQYGKHTDPDGIEVATERIIGDKYLLKKSSGNQTEYEMMRMMEKADFGKVPRYIETKGGIDKFTYIPGSRGMYLSYFRENSCGVMLAEFLREYQDICKQNSTDGTVYLHGNLCPENIVLQNDELVGIVNWEGCHIGDPDEDIIDIILNASGMDRQFRVNEEVLPRVIQILDICGLEKERRASFTDKAKSRIHKKIADLDRQSKRFERDYERLYWCLIFMDLYGDRM